MSDIKASGYKERIEQKLLETTSKSGLINLCKSRQKQIQELQEQLNEQSKKFIEANDMIQALTASRNKLIEQLKEERNDAIEDSINFLVSKFPEYGPKSFSVLEIRKELESLKK